MTLKTRLNAVIRWVFASANEPVYRFFKLCVTINMPYICRPSKGSVKDRLKLILGAIVYPALAQLPP